jgi:hypothetical protein
MTDTSDTAPVVVTPGQALHDSLRSSATDTFGLLVSDFATWDQVPQWQRDRLENAARDAIAAHKAGGGGDPDPRLVALDPAMLHKELRELIQAHEQTLEEILKNTGDEPDTSDAPEDFAVRYVRHLEGERDVHRKRLAMLLADTPFELRPGWEHDYDDVAPEDGMVEAPQGDDSAPFGASASNGHAPGCGCRDCCEDAAVEQAASGPVYGGAA